MVCFICLKEKYNTFDIFQEDKDELHIADTIKKHLWFLEVQLKSKSNDSRICNECWKIVKNFDLYFNQIQEAHQPKQENEDLIDSESQFHEIKVEPFWKDEDNFTIETHQEDSSILVKDENTSETIMKKSSKSKISKKSESTKKSNSKRDLSRLESEKLIQDYCKPICEMCSIQLSSIKELFLHYPKFHNIQGYVKCCNSKFSRFSTILNHVKFHLNPNLNQCDICNRSFTNKDSLARHKKGHNHKTIKCPYSGCSKTYPSPHHLNIHVKRTHEMQIDNLICDLCNKLFPDKIKFKNHFTSVHSKESFVCDQCGRSLPTKSRLKAHRMTHFDDERVQCSICSHWIRNKRDLLRHMKEHDERKQSDFACEQCSKVFQTKRTLRAHILRVHLAEWKYECNFCDKKFKKDRNLKEHVAALHTGDTLYKCDFCDKTSNNSSNLAQHRKKAHPEEWKKYIQCRYTRK